MNKIDYLIVSSSIDYSTDLVCYELHERHERYLRINRDQFNKYDILFSVENSTMTLLIDGNLFTFDSKSLKGVYFRAPVFIRSHRNYSLNQQLSRSQWNAFIRNLVLFENAKWINNPVCVYKAENKIYQLTKAKEIGLCIPKTLVGNTLPQDIVTSNQYAVKSLDTALFYDGEQELFTYTSVVDGTELIDSNIKDAPIILQEFLDNKQDVRVTVIGNRVFAVSITKSGNNIFGDWRKNPKENLTYSPITLPEEISYLLLELMKNLGLSFAGIDLAFTNGRYYFIEINPTGEWGWLSPYSEVPLEKTIVDELMDKGNSQI